MKNRSKILIGLAVLGFLIFALVPDIDFEEKLFPIQEGLELVSYDDQADGGSSAARMALIDSSLVFDCRLDSNLLKNAWCGLIWSFVSDEDFHFQNWTFVDTLILEADVKGISEILIKVWTYDPDVTDLENKTSFRLLIKEVPLKEGIQRISIPFNDFYTPDYWYSQTKTDKNWKKRHQESVAKVEITPGWNALRGVPFQLSIKSFSAKGVSNTSLGILLVFFTVLMMIAIGARQKK